MKNLVSKMTGIWAGSTKRRVGRGEPFATAPSSPRYYLAFIILLGLCTVGCGHKLPSQVSGTVTLDGKALPVGTVTFRPVTEGAVAYGSIDPNGNYTVRTGTDKGLVSGEYVVTVVATTGVPPMGKLLIPPRYGNPKESGLRFTVDASTNRIDLPLRSK